LDDVFSMELVEVVNSVAMVYKVANDVFNYFLIELWCIRFLELLK